MKKFEDTSSSSDKIWKHGYQRFYPTFLDKYQEHECELLEIGVHQEESIQLWKEYLPKSNISGIDIDVYSSSAHVTMYQLDQSKQDELLDFAKSKHETFDIILDDGSHVPDHQLLTLKTLWPCLKEGGTYIIEDIETSYWKKSSIYGYKFDARKVNTIESMKKIIDEINLKFSLSKKNKGFESDVESISFGENCIILIKKSAQFAQYYDNYYANWFEVNKRSFFYWPRRIFRRLFSFVDGLS